MNNANQMTVRDYARVNGISEFTARYRIKKGQVQTKKIKGITYIITGNESASSSVPLTAQEEKENLEWMALQNDQKKIKNEIQIEKLKNLRQDVILKQLKQQAIKEKYRRQFAQEFFECFTDSFADVKNVFIDLKLNKQQNEKLKNAFKKSIEKFRKKLTDKLKKNQEQDNTENETE